MGPAEDSIFYILILPRHLGSPGGCSDDRRHLSFFPSRTGWTQEPGSYLLQLVLTLQVPHFTASKIGLLRGDKTNSECYLKESLNLISNIVLTENYSI